MVWPDGTPTPAAAPSGAAHDGHRLAPGGTAAPQRGQVVTELIVHLPRVATTGAEAGGRAWA
ncbi:hypothetical protein GCM10023221_04690 [Luteimicrobium xylanilyticum]